MSLADFASAKALLRPGASAPMEAQAGKCPFHQGEDSFNAWLEQGLQCMAGKREFRLGRYHVARFRSGREYATALAEFRHLVATHQKTGFLAILMTDERCPTVEDELNMLGAAMYDAGLTDDLEALIGGKALAHSIEVPCPVTGRDTFYEFFSVAFTRNAANPLDPLYDPSLSAPFTAVNTTSDAFAFARLVNDQAMRAWGRPVHAMTHDRDAVERLFSRCVTAWQNMSITTISNYSRVTAVPSRGVHLSEDRMSWFAAHNDPVFAELKKCPYQHEMPATYATRLTAKWSANLFDGKPYVPSRDGQSGGVAVSDEVFEVEGLSSELLQF
ncbi:MAG TPA: hypothetical protein VHA70_10605 [Bauldia sp.]|nr:hypothetical protein [Bauldia sp.]